LESVDGGLAVVLGAAVYTIEWVLAVPSDDALVDATLSGFVMLLILGWWRSRRG
jgi:hypothetical protein